MLRAKPIVLSGYSVAVVASLLAVLLRFLLAPLLHESAPLLVFILPVLFSAYYGGFRTGVFATLGEVVVEALQQLTTQIQEKNAQIHYEMPLPTVMAHRSTVTQVIVNLLSNAVKFVEINTQPQIDIFTTVERHDGRHWIRLWIVDNGIGIAPEHQEQIFRVFERLHGAEHYPGTGIGLAIVRQGLERMGGKVGLESQLGQGSRFWIALPNAVLASHSSTDDTNSSPAFD